MGTKLVTNRNITITSKSGSSIKFERGVPTHVPDQAIEDCMAAGAVPAEGEVVKAHKSPALEVAAPTGVERKQRILDAIDQMVMLNERGTFNANGTPKQPQLEKIVGFVIDTREVETLWHEFDRARKQATEVDASEVVTINDAAPVVTEHDNEKNTVGEKAEAKKDLGRQATEGQKTSAKPVKTAPKVTSSLSRSTMVDALKRANIKFPGNISNVKLEEIYMDMPKTKEKTES